MMIASVHKLLGLMWLSLVFVGIVILVQVLIRQSMHDVREVVTTYQVRVEEPTEQELEMGLHCQGWVTTGVFERTTRISRHNWRVEWVQKDGKRPDMGCLEVVPVQKGGYCMYKNMTSDAVVPLMERAALDTGRSMYRGFTCRDALNFARYKTLVREWKEDKGLQIDGRHKRGIVMSVGQKYLIEAYANVKWLRHIGCKLPIEFWTGRGELNMTDPRLLDLLKDPLLSIKEVTDPAIHGWFLKPYSLYYTKFEQVLLLDCDSFSVRNPEYLFETKAFRKTGAWFFKDRIQPKDTIFMLNDLSIVWDLLGIKFVNEFEQESGQMLVDRRRSKKGLNALMYLTRTFDEFLGKWNLVYGDKELYRFAWRIAESNYTFNPLPPGELGVNATLAPTRLGDTETYQLCSGSMAQFDDSGNLQFVHQSLPKMHDRPDLDDIWHFLIKFNGTDELTQHDVTFTHVKPSMSYNEEPLWFCAWRRQERIDEGMFEIIDLRNDQWIRYMEKTILGFVNNYAVPTSPPTPSPVSIVSTSQTALSGEMTKKYLSRRGGFRSRGSFTGAGFRKLHK